MKNLRKLPGLLDYKSIKVNEHEQRLKYYLFDSSELLGKEGSTIVVTQQPDCMQISVCVRKGLPSFEDCVKAKQFLFDEDEAVFLVLKNLRLIDDRNLSVRMFYSEEISSQAKMMDFCDSLENTYLMFTKKRPVIKAKRNLCGFNVNIIARENRFPSLEEAEEAYQFALKIPLIAIRESQMALNPKHMLFVCDGDKMKLPKTLNVLGRLR